MKKKIKIKSRAEFTITIKHRSDDSAQVEVSTPEGVEYVDIMCAAEYLIWMCSHLSGFSIEEVAEKLARGAKTYRTAVIPIREGRE